MKTKAIDFVVYAVPDMKEAYSFYKETLGIDFPLVEEGDFWTEFDTPPVALALCQPKPRGKYSWSGPAGTAARLASALKGWQRVRFEVTEEATTGTEAERYSYTPSLGIFHATTGIHGDIMIPEDRLKHAIAMSALGGKDLLEALYALLGRAWDEELEPFRYAGDGAPVRWLHKVV